MQRILKNLNQKKQKTSKANIALFQKALSYETKRVQTQYNFVFNKYILDVKDPQQAILDAKISDVSKNNYLAAYKFYLRAIGFTDAEVKMIKIQGVKKALPSWYVKMQDILDYLSLMAENYDNLALAYYIMCRTGLRADELGNVDWPNIQSHNIVVKTKGNKAKHIWLPQDLAIFIFQKFKVVSYKELNAYGDVITTEMSLEEKFTPHQCRYLYGNNLYVNYGLSKVEVMELLGHDDLATTDVYLFDDYEKLQRLNNLQYSSEIEAIEQLEDKEKAAMYKKLYTHTLRKARDLEYQLYEKNESTTIHNSKKSK